MPFIASVAVRAARPERNALPFLFIPVTTASYHGLDEVQTSQAAGLINVARNLGGSIAVAMAQTIVQRSTLSLTLPQMRPDGTHTTGAGPRRSAPDPPSGPQITEP